MTARAPSLCVATSALALMLLATSGGTVQADQLRIGGTGSVLSAMGLLAEAYVAGHPGDEVAILPSIGSRGGVLAVLDGTIGLAVTSRAPLDSERELGAVGTEFACTPFVAAVSSTSPVTGITTRELVDIFSGATGNWPDGSQVRVVLRPVQDIDTEMVKNISPEMHRAFTVAAARPGVRVAMTDLDAVVDLQSIPGAIGFTSLTLIVVDKRPLRALAYNGWEPTVANAAAGLYPLHKTFFFVSGARRSPVAARFVAFVQSPQGKQILASSGMWVP